MSSGVCTHAPCSLPGPGADAKNRPHKALSFLPSKWDYRENCPLNKLFGFVKYIGNFISLPGKKNLFMLFLNAFCNF